MVDRIREDMVRYKGLKYIADQMASVENKLTDLEHYGMILLGPDSFQQNETNTIIDFFEKNNFRIVDVKIKKLSRTEAETLFLPTSTCMNCGDLKWWMIQDAADAGPFAAVLIYCKDLGGSQHCLEKLNLYKGKSDPLSNGAGVIRYDHEAINVCLNLLHIPDNYGDFFKDTSPFYTVDDIVDILSKEDLGIIDMNGIKFQISLLERSVREYVFEETVYKLKYLIAASIPIPAIERKLLPIYQNKYEVLRGIKRREAKNDLYISSMNSEKAKLNELKKYCINKIIAKINDTYDLYMECYDKLRLLDLLTDPKEFKKYQYNYFFKVYGYGIVFSRYEELIINTSLMQWRE